MDKDLRIGDLVTWAPDGDIGIVIDIDIDERDNYEKPEEHREPYFIHWRDEASASGWHGLARHLKLLNSV